MIGEISDQRDGAVPRVGALRAFRERMAPLAADVKAIDLRHFETLAADRSSQELLPITVRSVKDARVLVADVLDACARAGDGGTAPDDQTAALNAPFLPFERALDAAVEGGVASLRAVEDIAFIVQLELRQRDERLGRITAASGSLAVIGECDSALRRVRKGLAALDLAIARAEGLAPTLDFSSELHDSLRVRRAYARFRVRLLALADGAATRELYPRMRAAGTHIAMLVGWDAYPLLRVRDRLQLRELQQRILEWLRPELRDDHTAGTRLWQDVVGFVEMLALVNRRQELVEHDARLVADLLRRVQGLDQLDDGTRAQLDALDGMDDELDRLLAAEAAPALRAWQDALQRIALRLGVAREGTA